jgi:hypothetical protein
MDWLFLGGIAFIIVCVVIGGGVYAWYKYGVV